MAIRLLSTTGGFSREFTRKLPELEKAMLAHGLEPEEFLISKDRASPGAPWITPFFYQYTVFVGDENFTRGGVTHGCLERRSTGSLIEHSIGDRTFAE